MDADRIAHLFADLASKAGRAILDVYETPFEARHKGDASPVTDADDRAEAIILEGLARDLPGVAVVSEEAVARGDAPAPTSSTFVLVDPLDGTREFVARSGEFTVNIALIDGGVPAASALYVPLTGVLYIGGQSAWRRKMPAGSCFDAAAAEPIRTRAPGRDLVAVASRSHRDRRTDAWLVSHGITTTVTAGSALKFGLVAEGRADVYPRFSPTSQWDVAAGHAVLRAAGGTVTRPDGSPFPYGLREGGYPSGDFIAWGRQP